MQSDLKQQDDDADLAQGVEDVVGGIEQAEERRAEENPRDELAEDGRLARVPRQLAGQS